MATANTLRLQRKDSGYRREREHIEHTADGERRGPTHAFPYPSRAIMRAHRTRTEVLAGRRSARRQRTPRKWGRS